MNELFYTARKFKTATTLNLLGLAAALTACYILATQVQFARNFNKNIPEWENVYRVEANAAFDEKWAASIPQPLVGEMKKRAEVEEIFVADYASDKKTQIEVDGRKFTLDIAKTDRRCLRALRPTMLCGVDTLSSEREAILPASEAEKLFGERNAVGKNFVWDKESFKVVGVFKDFPQNCLTENVIYTSFGNQDADNCENWNYFCLVRMIEGADLAGFEKFASKTLSERIYKAFGVDEAEKGAFDCNIRLRNVSETYSSGVDPEDDKGNPALMGIISMAILLLLIVAAINFANFTLAETPMKIRAINTKKVLGMTNLQLRREFICGTVAGSLAAFVLSLLFCWLLSLAPWMSDLVIGSIALADNLYLIIYTGAAALTIGVLVGLYPAWYATSFPPAMVLKGAFGLSPRGVFLRKTLLFVQLVIAFGMTFYLSVLLLQKDYIHTSNYGFAKDEVMFSRFSILEKDLDKFRSELEKIPGVESVGVAGYVPGVSTNATRMTRDKDGTFMNIVVNPCDWKFLKTIGIEIVEGRDFSPQDKDCYIVNETALKKYEWMGVDKPLTDGECNVIGVCRNFRVFTTREDNSNEAAAFVVLGDKLSDWRLSFKLFVRVGKNVDKLATKKAIEQCASLILHRDEDDNLTEFRFFDDQLQQTYEEEFRFIRQVEIFAFLCLLITLIGVFCLTMFETAYRRREIGLRRIMGSLPRDIILMFCRRYLLLILPAFALAAPLAWRMSGEWLENFAERITIPLWLPALSFLLITLIVLSTVALQTWRTCLEQPVEAIKVE